MMTLLVYGPIFFGSNLSRKKICDNNRDIDLVHFLGSAKF